MRYFTIFIIVFISLSFIVFNKQNGGDRILWAEDAKLTYEDFRKTPPENLVNKDIQAVSRCDLTYNIETLENKSKQITLKTYFIKDSSWIAVKNQNTLDHEQVHFDLAELYTRKMRNSIAKLQEKGVTEDQPYLDTIHHYIKENNKVDKLFDKQCFALIIDGVEINGTNVDRQNHWEDSIKKELRKLDMYKLIETE